MVKTGKLSTPFIHGKLSVSSISPLSYSWERGDARSAGVRAITGIS
jgi:hypothetical protein